MPFYSRLFESQTSVCFFVILSCYEPCIKGGYLHEILPMSIRSARQHFPKIPIAIIGNEFADLPRPRSACPTAQLDQLFRSGAQIWN